MFDYDVGKVYYKLPHGFFIPTKKIKQGVIICWVGISSPGIEYGKPLTTETVANSRFWSNFEAAEDDSWTKRHLVEKILRSDKYKFFQWNADDWTEDVV